MLVDSATSALKGLTDKKAALINDRAALINAKVALIHERAALTLRVSQSEQIIDGVTQSVKRLLDESDKSSISSKRSSVLKRDQVKQTAFKRKVVARDRRCILTGSDPVSCEAAHIIPWTFHRDNEVVVFTGDQDDWPGEEFLKHHNRTFNFRQEKLKAAAETGFMEKSESTDMFTNDNLEENHDLSKLADDMWEESQTTSTFLSLE
ncbi:hypothetical protein HDU80_009309 [Chytriomyces hyalinus]|nr:hypothetical protein HDU80_009309 [Chytriomyces hyalinus]